MIHLIFQPTLSNHRDQYNISWVVQSYAPILEYRLFYRKQTTNGNTNPTSNNDVIHYEKYVCISYILVAILLYLIEITHEKPSSPHSQSRHLPANKHSPFHTSLEVFRFYHCHVQLSISSGSTVIWLTVFVSIFEINKWQKLV